MGQRQQQRKRNEIQGKVKDYTIHLKQDTGLTPTNLQMQTATGEKVTVKLYPEVLVATENQPIQLQDKPNQMAYLLLRNKISMDCYHEISMQFPNMPRSNKVHIATKYIIKTPSHSNIHVYNTG